MRPWLTCLIGAALAAPAGRPLAAQEPRRVDTVLTRLTAEALAASPSLAADHALARAAKARIRPSGSLPDPMLTVGVMDLTLPRFAFRESDFTEVDVELSQEVPWPGTLGTRTRAAQAEARQRVAGAAARRREITLRTASLYYRLRYVAAARETLGRQRELLAAAVEISTARYASTNAPQSDPLQARVALARLATEAEDFGAQDAELRAELRALRNAPAGDSIRVEPIRPEQGVGLGHHAERATVPGSLPSHPRIAMRVAGVEAAEEMARVERLGARPDFTFMARYGARPLGSDFFSAFVAVRLPIFAGRKQHRLAEAAELDAKAARAAVAEETAALEAEIQGTLARIRAGERRLGLLVTQVIPASRATAEASLRGYRVGRVDFLNVLAAEDARYRAELDAASEAAEHLTHLVMLEQLLPPKEES